MGEMSDEKISAQDLRKRTYIDQGYVKPLNQKKGRSTSTGRNSRSSHKDSKVRLSSWEQSAVPEKA